MARGRSEFRLRLVAEEVGRASAEFQKFGQLSQEALDRLKLSLDPVNDNLRKVDDAASKFKTSLRETAASVAVLDGPLGGMASRLNALATTIGTAGLLIGGIGVAAAAAAFGLVKLTQATSDFERSQLRLQNVLKATGNEAFVTLKEINDLALELSRDTLASLDEARTAGAAVLTSPNIRGVEDVERILRLAQDFTEVFAGTSLAENARFLGAAFDSPISAFDNLRERGIKLSDQLRETLRTLEESGQRAEAAGILFAELERRVGGAGEIGGLPGTLHQVGVELERNVQLFGELLGISDAVATVMQQVADSQRALGDAVEGYLRPSIQSLEADLTRLREERDQLQSGAGAGAGPIGTPATRGALETDLTAQIDALQRQISERGAETTAQQRAGDFATQAREMEALAAQEQRLSEALDAVSKAFTPQREAQLQKILEAGGGEAGLGPEGVAEVEQTYERQRLITEEIKEAQRLGKENAREREQEQKRAIAEAEQLAERMSDVLRSLEPPSQEKELQALKDRVAGTAELTAAQELLIEQAYREQQAWEKNTEAGKKFYEEMEKDSRRFFEVRESAEIQEQNRITRQIERLRERLDPLAEFRRVDEMLAERQGAAATPAAAAEFQELRDLNLQDLELPSALAAIENAGAQAFQTIGENALAAAQEVRSVEDATRALQDTLSEVLNQFASTLLQIGVVDPLARAAATGIRQSFVQGGIAAGVNRFFAGGFQHGGSFTVPGGGPADSVMTSMLTTPGERVTVDAGHGGPPTGPTLSGEAILRVIMEGEGAGAAGDPRMAQLAEAIANRGADLALRRLVDGVGGRNRTMMRTFGVGRRR